MTDLILDARMIRHSGIGTYLRCLLDEFQSLPFFKKITFETAGDSFPFRAPIYSLREQLEYPFHLRRGRVWHAPHYNVPLLQGRTRLVVTIHDLIHWVFRKEFYSPAQGFYAQFFLKRAIQQAEKIIAVSHKTREDLIYYFNAPAHKIRVIYEAVSERFFKRPLLEERNSFLKRKQLPKEFFLYVGLIKPHKNVERLVRVYEKLKKDRKLDWDLVLVGKKDPHYLDLQNKNGLHYIERMDTQDELALLYASAQALVHPSLYEGFGLTVLEAMASGTPVISSRAGALPEVTGTAARFVDPASDSSLEEALLEMESSDTLRQNLGEAGILQARKFSWKKTAEETVQVYQEVLDSK